MLPWPFESLLRPTSILLRRPGQPKAERTQLSFETRHSGTPTDPHNRAQHLMGFLTTLGSLVQEELGTHLFPAVVSLDFHLGARGYSNYCQEKPYGNYGAKCCNTFPSCARQVGVLTTIQSRQGEAAEEPVADGDFHVLWRRPWDDSECAPWIGAGRVCTVSHGGGGRGWED